MLKRLLCSAMLLYVSVAQAQTWEKEFFSPLSNELPPARGVAVDEQGYVHLQAFNRLPGDDRYIFAHQYTIGANGQVPWIWGLSMADRMSDCGVYARSGQRFDCLQRDGYGASETRLEMRGRHGSDLVWQFGLPYELELLDASITAENEALFVAKLGGAWGPELGVFRANSSGAPDVLSVVPACPHPGQGLLASRLRMPSDADGRIYHVKACWNSYGSVDLIQEAFDRHTWQWSTLYGWTLPFGAAIEGIAMLDDGNAFVLFAHDGGPRELLAPRPFDFGWHAVPFPFEGRVDAFLNASNGLLAVLTPMQADPPGTPPLAMWFDTQHPFWPIMQPLPALSDVDRLHYAASGTGALIAVGYTSTPYAREEIVWRADRFAGLHEVARRAIPAKESIPTTVYALGGPGNVAVVARTIVREDDDGNLMTGLRVNQYDLPPTP